MKSRAIILALLGCAAASPALASYTIDGDLSDWGVAPFTGWTGWIPNGTADYAQTDNVNLYNAQSFSEPYDWEAMYFDDDAQNFYFAVVGSYPIGEFDEGDLGFDLNGDMTISEHGAVTGLEFALDTFSGQILANPTWADTYHKKWADGWQGTPHIATGGTVLGIAQMVIVHDWYLEEDGAYILEASIPRSLLPDFGGEAGDTVGIHITQWCGNDSINLFGTIDTDPYIPPVPAPGALLLGGLGMGLVGWLRRRRAL